MPTPVSTTSIRAPSVVDCDRHPDRPAARRELDRVADEVRDDLADARRIVADADRGRPAGPARPSRRDGQPGRRAGGRPIRRPPAGRRAAGRAARARSRASRARAGSGPASRAGRSGLALDSRNSARASGSSPARSMSSWLNVRSAASGVRSSWETSARKSRLRSRSRRMSSTLSASRSAIVLNWTASSPSSEEPGAELRRRHASRQVALGERARGVGQLPERCREPPGQCRRDDDREARARTGRPRSAAP